MKSAIFSLPYAILQEIRSYKFLAIMVCSILLTLGFIPAEDASYSTIAFGRYIPEYNGAWICSASAIMSNMVIAIFGGYLVSDSIQRDKTLRLSSILAAAPISNFKFAIHKALSNFLLLSIIIVLSMITAAVLVTYHNSWSELSIVQLVYPYLCLVFPTVFFVGAIAVILELILPNNKILRYILFLFIFIFSVSGQLYNSTNNYSDVFGLQYATEHLTNTVTEITNDSSINMSIGISKNQRTVSSSSSSFTFDSFDFDSKFVTSRFILFILSIGLIKITSMIFSCFNNRQKVNTKTNQKKAKVVDDNTLTKVTFSDLHLNIKSSNSNFIDLILAELFIAAKSMSSKMIIASILLSIATVALSVEMAHTMILPILLLIQVPVISTIATRDINFRTNNIMQVSAYSNSKIISSRILATSIVLITVALPLMVKMILMEGMIVAAINIVIGCICITIISTLLGMIVRNNKFFEVLMIFVTYSCINSAPITDYLGATQVTIFPLLCIIGVCAVLTFLLTTNKMRVYNKN